MPNPLDALKQASSIGPAFDPKKLPNPKLGMMPLDPSGVEGIMGIAGKIPSILSGLKSAITGGTEGMAGMAQSLPQYVRSAVPASETLGEIDPEWTPVGGEEMYNVGKYQPDPTKTNVAELVGSLKRSMPNMPPQPTPAPYAPIPSPVEDIHPWDLSKDMGSMRGSQDMLNPAAGAQMDKMYQASKQQQEANPALKALYNQLQSQAADRWSRFGR